MIKSVQMQKKRTSFDSFWRERLKDYPQSQEYETNLQKLKQEFDKTLPKEKPERKLAFVFMGIPGSGKSTIAQIIRKIHSSIILRADWIFFEKLNEQIKDDYYKAYSYQEELARKYLNEGYSVIMDDNNRTVKNRTEVYKWARESGAEPVLIKIDVDLETAVDRVTLKGGKTQTRKEKLVGLKEFASQTKPPTPKEAKSIQIIKINGNESLEKIKNQLERKIKNL